MDESDEGGREQWREEDESGGKRWMRMIMDEREKTRAKKLESEREVRAREGNRDRSRKTR